MNEQVNKNVFVFDFDKRIKEKEIEVAGVNYTLSFDDKALEGYQLAVVRFRDNYKKLEKLTKSLDYDTVDEKTLVELSETQTILLKQFISAFLGEEGYNDVYVKAGRSNINLMALVPFLSELLDNETKSLDADLRAKYLNK